MRKVFFFFLLFMSCEEGSVTLVVTINKNLFQIDLRVFNIKYNSVFFLSFSILLYFIFSNRYNGVDRHRLCIFVFSLFVNNIAFSFIGRKVVQKEIKKTTFRTCGMNPVKDLLSHSCHFSSQLVTKYIFH